MSLPAGYSASPPGPGPAAAESPSGPWALRLAGVLGAWAACPFFSSEKSCLITSKKLLNGLPGCTEQKTKEKKKREKRREGGKREQQTNERKACEGVRVGERVSGAAAASRAGGRWGLEASGLRGGTWDRWAPSSLARPPEGLALPPPQPRPPSQPCSLARGPAQLWRQTRKGRG